MYRNYYSMNDMPSQSRPAASNGGHINEGHKKQELHKSNNSLQERKLFDKFELDDIIILAVAIILLADECDDKLLLAALGIIFLS